jgi:hypothetical protein
VLAAAGRLKKAGNDALNEGNLEAALGIYRAAMVLALEFHERGEIGTEDPEDELRAVAVALSNNAALVLLKMAGEEEADACIGAAADLYVRAQEAAEGALDLDPANTKAQYRKNRAKGKAEELGRRSPGTCDEEQAHTALRSAGHCGPRGEKQDTGTTS